MRSIESVALSEDRRRDDDSLFANVVTFVVASFSFLDRSDVFAVTIAEILPM